MSRAGAGGQGGLGDGLYGDPNPAAGFNPLDHDDVDSFFFHNRSPRAAGEGGGDGYSSITDYLQGFLADDDVKEEMVVVQAASGRRDDQMSRAPVIRPSSSVLSSSSEAGGGEEQRRRCKEGRPEEEVDDDEGPAADGKCKRNKKSGEKKEARQPRVAFKTKSEVDHLEDGYRWRKYGQKTVKNSSYPRSYYRCTAARCGVKKLVERSQQDPSSVITTYEGQHTHPSPVAGARAAQRVLLHNNGFSLPMQHQLGFIRPDDLARMACTRSSPAGDAMPPPPMHLLRQDP